MAWCGGLAAASRPMPRLPLDDAAVPVSPTNPFYAADAERPRVTWHDDLGFRQAWLTPLLKARGCERAWHRYQHRYWRGYGYRH